MTRMKSGVLAIGLGAAIIGTNVRPQAEAGEEGMGPLAILTGPRSQVKDAEVQVVRDQRALDAVWKEHVAGTGEEQDFAWLIGPQIDFDRAVVVATFAGESINCRGFQVVETRIEGETRTVRYDRSTFQTIGKGMPASPWALFVLPRFEGTTVMEVNTQGLIGQPPIWTERVRFDAAVD